MAACLVRERIFRSVNGASDRLRVPVRAVMQAGTFATVPAASAVALLMGRRRLAASLLVSGTVAWLGAKAAKPLAGRARPETVLGDVRVREGITGDLGWVSGHMAVATTLAYVGGRRGAALGPPSLARGRRYHLIRADVRRC